MTNATGSRSRVGVALRACARVALAVVAIEVAAWIVALVAGRPSLSHARIVELREQRAGEALAAERKDRIPVAGEAPGFYLPALGVAEVVHPYLGFVLERTKQFQSSGAGIDMENLGFGPHSGTLLRDPGPEDATIAIFGGSVAANFVRNGRAQRLAERLTATEPFRGKRLRVVLAGLGGYKQPQALMALEYLLALGARIDVALLLDGFNDVVLPMHDNLPNGVFPIFPRMWDARVRDLPSQPLQVALGRLALDRERRRDLAIRFAGFPLRFSRAAELAWFFLDARLTRAIVEDEARAEALRPRGGGVIATGPERVYASEDDAVRDVVATWRRSSLQMAEAARAKGISFVHFLQPNQYVPGSKPLGEDERARAFDEQMPYRHWVEVGYPRLVEAGESLRAAGVAFHDLSRAFADVHESLYVDTCCHFRPEGYDVLMESMVPAIVAAATPRAASAASVDAAALGGTRSDPE